MINAKRLKKKMELCGYTQKEVAEYLGVGQGTFGDWLKAGRMRTDYLEKLALLLGITSYDFFFTTDSIDVVVEI
jgi:transcriptional regulator with XRE-family HTH domain